MTCNGRRRRQLTVVPYPASFPSLKASPGVSEHLRPPLPLGLCCERSLPLLRLGSVGARNQLLTMAWQPWSSAFSSMSTITITITKGFVQKHWQHWQIFSFKIFCIYENYPNHWLYVYFLMLSIVLGNPKCNRYLGDPTKWKKTCDNDTSTGRHDDLFNTDKNIVKVITWKKNLFGVVCCQDAYQENIEFIIKYIYNGYLLNIFKTQF